ncbi:MAG: DUF393 domain-containing protein [Planctomycetota bacterium]
MGRRDAARDVCFFDGACGFCRGSTRVLGALDWFGRLAFCDMLTEPDLPVPIEEAMAGMPMRTRAGAVLVGFPAVRRALRQTPLGFLPALLLHIPGLSHAGRAGYEWVAGRRSRDACRVRASE